MSTNDPSIASPRTGKKNGISLLRLVGASRARLRVIAVDVCPRPFDELNVSATVYSEEEAIKRPHAVYFMGREKCLRFAFRAYHGKVEVCALDSRVGHDLPIRTAYRDRGSEKAGHLRTGLKSGCGKLKGLGMAKDVGTVVDRSTDEHGNRAHPTKVEDAAPYRPFALNLFETFDAVPVPVLPRPSAPHYAEHKGHDHVEDRQYREQRDRGPVEDAPKSVQQKRAPIPAIDFWRYVLGPGIERQVLANHFRGSN